MIKLLLKICLVVVALFGSGSVGFASDLSECAGSPTKRWLVTKNWNNCKGVYIFTGWGLVEGHTFIGEFQDGERYGHGTWTFPNQVREGFWIGTNLVRDNKEIESENLINLLKVAFFKLSEGDRKKLQSKLFNFNDNRIQKSIF